MKCPLCNTEMVIRSSKYVQNEGHLSVRQIYSCRNKNCSNFGKDVKTVYVPLDVTEDSAAPTEVEESE